MTDVDRLNEVLSGRYRIDGEIGEGGMATVFLARDLKHRRTVAIKVLKPELAALVGADRFLTEIETTANLQHPNILPLFDSGEADGFLFYVMPYVEGESLRDRLDRERQLPVDDAVAIAATAAEALDYAHREGVVHRDVKPANILLRDGKPLISDFGIALAVGAAGGNRLTETGLSLGTPHYMSPEQATGERWVGPPSDVYALACVLYEMLVGEPPYTGSTPQAILGKIITGEAAPVRDHRSSVPPNVEAAVRRALEKVPADRFASAREFADALHEPAFRTDRALAVDAGETRSVALFGGWAMSVVLALLLTWSLVRAPGAPDSERHFSILYPPETEFPAHVSDPVEITRDGARLFYVVERGNGRRELHTRAFSEPEGFPVPGVEGTIGSIFLSPDEEWLAFDQVDEGVIKKVPVEGGTPVTVAETGLGGELGWWGGAWGPDGTIVFVTAADPAILRVSGSGGTPVPVVAPDSGDLVRYRQPSFLPDGTGIVFTISGTAYPWDQRIAVLRFGEESGPTVLVEGHSPRVTADGRLVLARGGRGGRRGRGGNLWSARFEDDWSGLSTEPVPVLEAVYIEGFTAAFALSDDGTVAYVPTPQAGSSELVWADRGGRTETVLDMESPQLPARVLGFAAPRISPDGSRLAFRSSFPQQPNFRLFVLDIERRALNTITADVNADWPVWTPDGERLVFNRFTGEEQNLYWARADNTGRPEPLIPPNPRQQHAGSFTPDGRLLILQEREYRVAPDSDIHLLSMNGDESTRPFLDTPAFEIQPALSPDGQWLAYASDESGQLEVYVTDFPGRRSRTKISTEEAWQPAWNPAGDELFYLRRSPTDALMAVEVSVEGDSRFRAGVPELLFEGWFETCCEWGRNYDVAPDGRFALVRWEQGAGVPRVEVIQNWRAVLGAEVRE